MKGTDMLEIIEKWYLRLGFPKEYDSQFYESLSKFKDPGVYRIDEYDPKSTDAKTNLLMHLYFCNALHERYRDAGISENILDQTLSDIVIWTNVWYSMTGEVGLSESGWLKRHLSFKLFRLGRLQFCPGEFAKDFPIIGVNKGDPLLEVHIPEGGPLLPSDCDASFAAADIFFGKYFTDHKYNFYTCHSWLLDKKSPDIIKEGSNIWLFADRFRELEREESDAILRYVFRRDAKRENIENFPVVSGLARAVKEAIYVGKPFYEVLGYIKK